MEEQLLEHLSLSRRTNQFLKEKGLIFLSQIMEITKEDLKQSAARSTATIEEILEFQKKVLVDPEQSWKTKPYLGLIPDRFHLQIRHVAVPEILKMSSGYELWWEDKKGRFTLDPTFEQAGFAPITRTCLKNAGYEDIPDLFYASYDAFENLSMTPLARKRVVDYFTNHTIVESLQQSRQDVIDTLVHQILFKGFHHQHHFAEEQETCVFDKLFNAVNKPVFGEEAWKPVIYAGLDELVNKSLDHQLLEVEMKTDDPDGIGFSSERTSISSDQTRLCSERIRVSSAEDLLALHADQMALLLFMSQTIQAFIKKSILTALQPGYLALGFEQLQSVLPQGICLNQQLLTLLGQMEQKGILEFLQIDSHQKWRIRLQNLEDWLAHLPIQDQKIMTRRLDGMFLEDLDGELGCSREWVRQLILQITRNKPLLQTERCLPWYQNYSLCDEDLKVIFGLDSREIRLLSLLYQKGNRPITDLLEDNIPWLENQQQKIARALQENYVQIPSDSHTSSLLITSDSKRPDLPKISGSVVRSDEPAGQCAGHSKAKTMQWIPKEKHALMEAFAKTMCQKHPIPSELFWKWYREFLEVHHLKEQADLCYASYETFENRIVEQNYILASSGPKLRWYPINQIDPVPLVQALHLEERNNLEISARLLYREYPEWMESYQLQNADELFQYLKKTQENWQSVVPVPVVFGRMPHLEIGKANIVQQIRSLLDSEAGSKTWTVTEFAQLYESTYGIKAKTFLGSYYSFFQAAVKGEKSGNAKAKDDVNNYLKNVE